MLQLPIAISIGKNQVFVSNPALFTFHKLLTFGERQDKEKRLKDLYYAYYVLFFSPAKNNLPYNISKWMRKLTEGKVIQKNIEKYFADSDDQGPAWIEEVCQGTVIQTLVDDIRKDAFERIQQLAF